MESTSVIKCVGTERWAVDRRASSGRVSSREQNSTSVPRVSFPRMSTMLPGKRSRFARGERKECNTRTCITKNFVKKRSNHPSRIQLACAVEAWEAVAKALQASMQAKWNVSKCDCVRFWGVSGPLGKGDAHSRERARSYIRVPGGRVRQRAWAYFCKRPEWAVTKVLRSVGKARRNFEGEGETKISAEDYELF